MIKRTDGKRVIKRFSDAILLLIYAVIWGILTPAYFRNITIGSFVWGFVEALTCYCVLGAWISRVDLRLKAVDLPRWYLIPFVICPNVLLGVLEQLKIIGVTLSVVLFVATQIPTIFIKRRVARVPGMKSESPHE